MNKDVRKMIDDQINKEFYSAYLYLGISKYFALQNLMGFAAWYKKQAAEETEHAMKFYDFLVNQGLDVELPEVKAVTATYDSPLAAVKAADAHEKYVTAEINKIYAAAQADNDYPTVLFLNWFVLEQVEEEENSEEMIYKVEMLADSKQGLYLLDKEVGQRK